MPTLASFIKQKPRWKSKTSTKTPFSAGRYEIGSPHPYASPDIIDVHDQTSSFGSTVLLDPPPAPVVLPKYTHPSPNIKLDVELSLDPFEVDWSEHELILSTTPPQQKRDARGESSKVMEQKSSGVAVPEWWEPKGGSSAVPTDDDMDLSTSEDGTEVLDHLKAMGASNFLNDPEGSEAMTGQLAPPHARKMAPTPIRIPSLSMHGPQVQVVRSADHTSSRPLSAISSVESSAVSGQTLARALLGNSFVLSSDHRSSRYRSGFGLVRSDSATLPRGDHPLVNSPYMRERHLSGASETLTSYSNVPLPSNAGDVYVPPQTPRHSGIEMKKKSLLKRRSSTGSLATSPSVSVKDDSNEGKSRPTSFIDFAKEMDRIDKDIQALRRISRISEAASSQPTTPGNQDVSPNTSSPQPSPNPESSLIAHPESSPALSPLPEGSSQRLSTTSSNLRSPATSSSTKELDNVLDYYSFSDTPTPDPVTDRAFAPSFSPIIEVEELSSQASTPASGRMSLRRIPSGSRAMSPLAATTNGRFDLSSVRRPSDGAFGRSAHSSLFPIGERRRSIVAPVSQGNTSSQLNGDRTSTSATTAQRTSFSPVGKVVGGRLRSGSAPSPIKVDRDSRDLNAYKITVSPLPETAETPSTADSDAGRQTFPETPNAFSPLWSPNNQSPGMVQTMSDGPEVSPMPETPMSATLPSLGRGMPSIEQTVLLTRAATMVQTAHARQGSLSRFGGMTANRTVAKANVASSPTEAPSTTTNTSQSRLKNPIPDLPSKNAAVAHERARSIDSVATSNSYYSDASVGSGQVYEGIVTGSSRPTALEVHRPLPSPSSIQSSPRLGYLQDNASRSTYSSPSATPLSAGQPTILNRPPVEFTDPFNSQSNSSPLINNRSTGLSPLQHSLQTPPPVVITPPADSGESPYLSTSLQRISELSQSYESPPPYDTLDHDHPPPPSITPSSSNSNADAQFSASTYPSPSVHNDSSNEYLPLSRKVSFRDNRRQRMRPFGPRRPSANPTNTPSGGRPRNPSISSFTTGFGTPLVNPQSLVSTPDIPSRPLASTPLISSKSLASTPLTSPSNQMTSSPVVSPSHPPISTPSIPSKNLLTIDPPKSGTRVDASTGQSSSTINPSNGPTNTNAPSPRSPKFLSPPMKYRGLTMEQAKWTFTSAELRAVVSRAIRQSAEASSIRLLHVETLDNEIPTELKRLEVRKAEIKSQYRTLTRASEQLMMKLGNQIQTSNNNTQRTLDELRDVTRCLNKLTEELHYVDQQHTQITNLVHTHSASALSMALRKLNASLMKHMAETEELKKQVTDLEDEIWTINELRSTKEKEKELGQTQDSSQVLAISNETSSELDKKRSTMVTRKPSLRFSRSLKASASRISQRSSMSSAGRWSTAGGSGTQSSFAVPPVPPLPKTRPTDIITDVPSRSAPVISTDDGTPNTEIRALLRQQDELYHVLGMSLRGDHRLRRSRSVIGLRGNIDWQPQPSPNPTNPNFRRQPSNSRPGSFESQSQQLHSDREMRTGLTPRPVSYPGSLLDAYNPAEADRNAMLATLEMISQDN